MNTGNSSYFRNIVTIVGILVFATIGFAQSTYIHTIPHNDFSECSDVVETPDGGYFLLCIMQNGIENNLILHRINSDGELVSTHNYGITAVGELYRQRIISANDGNYLIASTYRGESGWLLKIDSSGDTLWTYRPTDNNWSFSDLYQTSDGSIYIVGGGNGRLQLLKFSAAGTQLWFQTYPGISHGGGSIIPAVDSGFVISSCVETSNYYDISVKKVDTAGIQQWTTIFGDGNDQIPTFIKSDAGYVVGGYNGGESWSGDNFRLRLNSAGDTVSCQHWQNSFYPACTTPLSDGGYIYGVSGTGSFGLSKFGANQNILWERTFSIGTNNYYFPQFIEEASDHSLIVTGVVVYPGGDRHDILIARTDSLGLIGQAVVGKDISLPVSVAMLSSYPNPFNNVTTISYSLPSSGNVELKILDLQGREVQLVYSGSTHAGSYRARFDGKGLASGTYFVRLQIGEAVRMQKIVLLK